MMLQDLYILEKYFSPSFSIAYEHDLIEKYGAEIVQNSIRDGLLDHSYVPCGKGTKRCVCRLSKKAIKQIENAIHSSNFI